jgi:SAM-dependent methyltransferase
MSTRDVLGQRVVPYFNGGLFSKPVTVPLGEAQLDALIKAAEANWKYVDPHIFGSVFQGIMNDAERHKSGAHYTAHEDIMRVVGPTIVEPWRKRIRAASTLTELLEVRKSLLAFRVLDPACGSGNFLYVAFRELYKLDTELLARLREFPSTQRDAATRITWGAGIQTSCFFGIDINPFAVALAKVTLNIAKKIAFDERREVAADLFGQVEMETDPSLPLDNLDQNVVCADALFTDWPEVDAIVGNPPFLGGSKIRQELGQDYLRKLQRDLAADGGVVDLACYWFRRAHDRLANGARAGLVATSGIRVGQAREASLDYIIANGGTITNAVSSRVWPGDAAVNVSMVNWVRGRSPGPHELVLDGAVFSLDRIPSHLQMHADVSGATVLLANVKGRSEGVNFGHEAFRSGSVGFPLSQLGALPSIRPVATGDDILRGKLSTAPDYCIYLDCATEREARAQGRAAFKYLEEHVFPVIQGRVESRTDANIYASWIRRWWQPWAPRTDFFAGIRGNTRVLVIPLVAARPVFVFISAKFIPNNTLAVFVPDDDYSFGIIQSGPHWDWTKAKGGKVAERIRYTNDVWTTFPWPQEPREEEVVAVAAAGRELRRVRAALMHDNSWSLRALYQAAEVPGPHPLKDAQAALDEAVRRAYGIPGGRDANEFLLELNKLVAEDDAEKRTVQGPGVPRGLDRKDPRWMSDDCIEPPAAPRK